VICPGDCSKYDEHVTMTPVPTLRRRLVRAALTVGALVLAATAAIAVSPGGSTTIAAIGDPLGAGGEFHRIDPVRIHDSRPGEPGAGPKGAR